MALLRYLQEGVPIEVTLDSDDITIGRGEDCIVRIHGDPEVSRLHCAIQRRDENAYVILDSASRNGTFVNGVRLMSEARELVHGDRIRIGHTKMSFYESEPGHEPGKEDVFEEIAREMDEEGKGFRTMMHEILDQPPNPRNPKTGS